MNVVNEVQAKSHYDVVVVGGGMSGISSVYHFLQKCPANSTPSLAILEGRSRLGGRIHAMDLPSKTVELGAQWIHGIIGNPICDIALNSRLVDPLSHESSPATESVQGKRYMVSGINEFGCKIPFDMIEETYQAYFMMLKQAESYFTCVNNDETINRLESSSKYNNSLGKHLVAQIEEYLKFKQKQLPSNAPDLKIIKGIFANLLQREACISGSHSIDDVSLCDFGSYEELPGGNLVVEGGFIAIINVLLDAIDSRIYELNTLMKHGKVETPPGHNNNTAREIIFDCLLEHEVTNIKWKGTSSNTCQVATDPSSNDADKSACSCFAEITCSNGIVITANHIIVTVPLGVLKYSHDKLFTPNLPEYKIKSINSLGFSVVDKVFLEFKNKLAPKFLDPSINEFLLIWTSDSDDDDTAMDCCGSTGANASAAAAPKYSQGSTVDTEGDFKIVLKKKSPQKWWRTMYSFTRISEYALLGWLSGEDAKYVESLDPTDVGKVITEEILRRFFHPEFPEPEITFTTKWADDPYSRGSYTFVATESSNKDIDLLSQPIYSDPAHEKPILLFAGESCHPNFYSTVHGAFLSGKKAASYLLDAGEVSSPN